MTGFEKLDQLINDLKIKTLECLNSIFSYILNEIPNQSKIESPFHQKALTLCPHFIQTLMSICSRPEIQNIILNDTYHDIIVEAIETLTHFVSDKDFFQLVVEKQRDLLVIVCLNLMRTSASEYDQMTSDPEQFVSLALDTCDK